jgi:hypothetical protein
VQVHSRILLAEVIDNLSKLFHVRRRCIEILVSVRGIGIFRTGIGGHPGIFVGVSNAYHEKRFSKLFERRKGKTRRRWK